MDNHYAAALAEISAHPWALRRSYLDGMVSSLHGGKPLAARQAAPGNSITRLGKLAVLPLHNLLLPRETLLGQLFGATALDSWTGLLKGLVNDSTVKTVIIDVSSPGGSALAVNEAAATIRRLARRKPVVAFADLAASAAYWLASSSSRIFAMPTAQLGSIGVFVRREDVTGRNKREGVRVEYVEEPQAGGKTEGWPDKGVTDEELEHEQNEIAKLYRLFVAAVATGRRVPRARVEQDFGRGRVVLGLDAVRIGMIDEPVGSLAELLRRLVGADRQQDLRESEVEVMAGGRRALDADRAGAVRKKEITELESQLRRRDLDVADAMFSRMAKQDHVRRRREINTSQGELLLAAKE